MHMHRCALCTNNVQFVIVQPPGFTILWRVLIKIYTSCLFSKGGLCNYKLHSGKDCWNCDDGGRPTLGAIDWGVTRFLGRCERDSTFLTALKVLFSIVFVSVGRAPFPCKGNSRETQPIQPSASLAWLAGSP